MPGTQFGHVSNSENHGSSSSLSGLEVRGHRLRCEACEKEVRDISIVRLKSGGWSQPEPLSQDGWEINGCPINGPAISSAGENLAAAWFTAASGEARVFAALSNDGGATFGPQIRVDGGNPAGRVDVAALPLGNAFVSWVERTRNTAEVRALLVKSDQSTSQPIVVGAAASGIPRLAVSGDEVVVAWTNSQDNKVRTSIVRIAGD